MKFVTKNSSPTDFEILHGNKKIAMVDNTKFLGLTLDRTLSCRTHTDSMAPKLSLATFSLRIVKPLIIGCFENGVLSILPFHYDLRNNILGELPL